MSDETNASEAEEQLARARRSVVGWFHGDPIDREDWYWKAVDELISDAIGVGRQLEARRIRRPGPASLAVPRVFRCACGTSSSQAARRPSALSPTSRA